MESREGLGDLIWSIGGLLAAYVDDRSADDRRLQQNCHTDL